MMQSLRDDEHNVALPLLHQMDHCWFCDNILRLRLRPSPSRLHSSTIELVPSSSLSNPTSIHTTSVHASTSHLPLPHFTPLPKRTIQPPHTVPKRFHHIHIYLPSWVFRGVHLNRHNPFLHKGNIILEKPKLPKLETSQHPASLLDFHQPIMRSSSTRHSRKNFKSMADLEVDELQGIMDLGLHICKDDRSPRVLTMLPALRHQLMEDDGHGKSFRMIKPHCPKAWFVQRSDSPLVNWTIPAPTEENVDMKEHLKFWARAVASTVRQEC